MRLGILAAEMEGQPTGVGRVVEGLLGGLVRTDFDGEVRLFFRGRRFEHPLWSDRRLQPVFAGRRGGSTVLWEQLALPRQLAGERLDVFLGPAYSLPPRLRCPSLVALHDLSFELLPGEYGPRERLRRRTLARLAARRASRVLTLSRAVARQIEERYGVSPDRIDLLPLGVDHERFARPASASGSGGTRSSYLLALGSLLPRRRIELVLEAFAAMAAEHPELELVIAGANRLRRPGDLGAAIDRLGLRSRVRELGWVAESELPALLQGALLSVYLSSYEGFGLPPLESLAAGTPAVVSAGLGLDDLWPDYPLRCARLEAAEVERVLRRGLDDAGLRERVAVEGERRARELTWEASARALLRSASRAIAADTVPISAPC